VRTLYKYHAGFRNQVVSWPTNPVSYYTSIISSYPKTTVVADLGCGDADLAKNLVPQGIRVLSFDLVSDGEWVVEADICDRIPLPGKDDGKQAQVVDIVVCALSLMNLNWIRCIREARRILKIGHVVVIFLIMARN
jgi:ribosomal RNA-processing protein 8